MAVTEANRHMIDWRSGPTQETANLYSTGSNPVSISTWQNRFVNLNMDPREKSQDEVANESAGIDQPVADTTASAEAIPATEAIAETTVEEGNSEEPGSEEEQG